MPKKYSDEYKRMILEELEDVQSISKIAKKYRLNTSLVYRWKKLYNDKGNIQLKFNEDKTKEKKPNRNNACLNSENLKLKNLLLKKEMEIQKLRDILRGLI